MIRNVTESQKRRVAGRQRFTCAGSVPDYVCPMKKEPFDESGYEIDHIQELRDGGTNDLSNLQALCISCHRVKTSRMTTAMTQRAASPIWKSSRLDAFRYKPKELPTKCHHCHDQYTGPLHKEKDLWFCHMHTPSSCEYLGCLGKNDVHAIIGNTYVTSGGSTVRIRRAPTEEGRSLSFK
jgi:hypothetical protein